MTKTVYKILLFDGSIANIEKIREVLSELYQVINPENYQEAVKLLSKESFDLVLISQEGFKKVEEQLLLNKKFYNPNLLNILIIEPAESLEARRLEESGKIYHSLETPISVKELKLTLKMAFKSYDILVEKNRLVSRLNRKALVLLTQRKKLSNALLRLKEANLDAIKVLSEAIEAKDPYTRGHCSRVSKLSKSIAEHLGYDERMITRLELGAFLHDIGKIGIRGAILNKDGKLTSEEMEHVKAHPVIGVNIIKNVEWCHKFIPMIKHHHEMLDGKGYPDGLKGEEIPLDARILGLADAFDAMTSERPYRHALPMTEALRRIREADGTQFDSKLVDIFIKNEIYKKDLSSMTGFSFKTEEEDKPGSVH